MMSAIFGGEEDSAMVVGPSEPNDNLLMDRSRHLRKEAEHRFQGYPEGNMERPKIPPLRAGLERAQAKRADTHRGNSPELSPHVDSTQLNELEKFRKHQVEAEEFIQQFKSTQVDKATAQAEEKKRDREMMKSYNPWGKPSAGVAHDDTRRKKWFVDAKAGRTLVTNETSSAPPDTFYMKFGAPGHGAPIRNEYGDIVADIPGAQEIRFKMHGPINFAQPYRYMGDRDEQLAYRSDLDKLVSQKAAEEQRKRANDLKSDMNHMQHNPFAHLGTRQTSQRPARLSHSQQTEPPKGHGTGQWPHYDPFGKQGAGAPIRDDHGNIVTVLSKVLTEAEEPQKAAATKAYVEELNKNAEQQRWNRYLEKEYARAPANDFASMVQEGKVGKPKRDPVTGLLLPHPMAFSDVSRHLYPSVRPDPKLQTDLDRVAMERAMTREMERHEMQQTDERSIEDGFGRPGAGAPNGDGNKKRKLDKVLFNANSERNDYFKTKEVVEPIATDMIPPVLQPPAGGAITQDVGPNGDSTRLNYVRNNVNSKHTNLYEYFQPKHPLQSKSPRDPFVKIAQYRLNAPFATPD